MCKCRGIRPHLSIPKNTIIQLHLRAVSPPLPAAARCSQCSCCNCVCKICFSTKLFSHKSCHSHVFIAMSSFRTDTSPAEGEKRLSINVEHLLEKKVCEPLKSQPFSPSLPRAARSTPRRTKRAAMPCASWPSAQQTQVLAPPPPPPPTLHRGFPILLAGLLVVFKCRDENTSMRKCLQGYPSKERMAELRADWRKDHPRPDGQVLLVTFAFSALGI